MYILIDPTGKEEPREIENLNTNISVIPAPEALTYKECIAFIEWCELRRFVPSIELINHWKNTKS